MGSKFEPEGIDGDGWRERGAKGERAISRRILLGGTVAAASVAAFGMRAAAGAPTGPGRGALIGPDGLRVEARPYGHSPTALDAVRSELESSVLGEHLAGARFRWLKFRRDAIGRQLAAPDAPLAFDATIYDYTNGRTLDLTGRIDDLRATRVVSSDRQPLPAQGELMDAIGVLRSDPRWGPAIANEELLPYTPMPPVIEDGSGHRVIAVGLFAPDPPSGTPAHQVVGVDLETGEPVTAPSLHFSEPDDCIAPLADLECDDTGTTGQAEIVVTRDGEELWRLVVVRPAESSGTNGSGVELRHVQYQGRSVLHRAHVPILNVEYGTLIGGGCGPTYRDWLDEESCFEAVGTDVTAGIRMCDQEPRTIMRSDSDSGNFHGAAIHLDGNEVVITSEMSAGWYRYVTEWKLHDDGNITPRFGFSAVRNPCTCNHHVHHAYWRFDWAVDGMDDHRVEEYNKSATLLTPDSWHTLEHEDSRDRDPDLRRQWRIRNRTTGAGFVLEPGWEDARADLYGAGDTWFVRHHPDEIDDGQRFTTSWAQSRARLDLFAVGEALDGHEVVSWYGGHWGHEHGDDGDWVGPRLRRIEP